MEVYKVAKVDNDGFRHWLTLVGVNGDARKTAFVSLYNEGGFFRVGTIFKRYFSINGDLMADSYRLGRYHFVDLHDVPKTKYDIEHFYADLNFCDRIRLQYDVTQSLKSRGIKASLSPQNNLRMLVFGSNKNEKVR